MSALNLAGIPAALKQRRQWVLWRYEGSENGNGKRDKVPYHPNGRRASVSDPRTWSDFAPVEAAAPRYSGIGIVCAHGLAGIDIDNCLDEGGSPSPLAQHIITHAQTYTQRTPSGRGLRCLFDGKLPGPGFKDDAEQVEFYDGGRYFTVTGDHWPGTPQTVEPREPQVAGLYRELRPEPPNPLAALVIPAAAIAQREARPVEWQAHRYIQRGELGLITALPGRMKSLMMLGWAACVAAGRNWLTRPDGSGGRTTLQAGVLWLNTDNAEQTHADRLNAVMRAMGLADIPLYSVTTTDFELKNPAHIDHVHDLADDLAAGVIVIDTLSGCLTGVNENSAEEMTAPAAHLRALAGNGRTVIGIHHPPKHDAEGSRCSSVLPGKVDWHYTVSRDGDLLTLKPQKVRNAPSDTFTLLASLASDPVTGALRTVNFFDGSAIRQTRDLEHVQDKILEALAAGPMNVRTLRKATRAGSEPLTAALNALATAQVIHLDVRPNREKVYSLVST
jgi:hypothetical protein